MEKESTQKSIGSQHKQIIIWIGALVLGALLGLSNALWLRNLTDFVATVFIRLFQLLAVPTIALSIINTLAKFGRQQGTATIFKRTLFYTVGTTLAAAVVGLILFVVISPGTISGETEEVAVPTGMQESTYYEHILNTVPNNVVRPFLEGNVLSVLLLALSVGGALAYMPESEGKRVVVNVFQGLQELVFTLIRALIWALPVGIVAFAAQFVGQMSGGVGAGALGRYVLVVLGGNLLQIFVVLPLFLLARGINPVRHFVAMSPALLMALFSKSSAATLPLTMETAEKRAGVPERVSRFVLPICTTINMNGCAAFILVTSLFIMQNSGEALTLGTMLVTLGVSVIAAVGNAGVPMGCYFLTFSLMGGSEANALIMGMILPIYALIDMVETAENVWSDSCVAGIVGKVGENE